MERIFKVLICIVALLVSGCIDRTTYPVYTNCTNYETIIEEVIVNQTIEVEKVLEIPCNNSALLEQISTKQCDVGLRRQLKFCESRINTTPTLIQCENDLYDCNNTMVKVREALE